MTNEMKAKLQESLANPEFYNALCDCMEDKEALAYFKTHGFELEEREALEAWNAAVEDDIKSGRLSDQELDKVAGGCVKICLKTGPFGGCSKWGCRE